LEEEKVFENKFSSILNEKEEEINHLQGLLKTKEESIKDLSQKFQGVQRELEGSPINNGKYFQEKLLEAEGYISELEKENEQLNYNCDDLK
jgi:DNA repair exonuclease SbcCD ATPase subunit